MEARPKCLVDGCEGKNESRGLCSPCMQVIYYMKEKGEITAQEVDIVLPKKNVRKDRLKNWIAKRLREEASKVSPIHDHLNLKKAG